MWMNPEGIMLSEKGQIFYVITYMLNQKNKTNVYNKTEIDSRYRKKASGYQWGEGSGEGQDRGMGLKDTNYYVYHK